MAVLTFSNAGGRLAESEGSPPVPNRFRGKVVDCEGLALATIFLQGSSTTAGRITRSSD